MYEDLAAPRKKKTKTSNQEKIERVSVSLKVLYSNDGH